METDVFIVRVWKEPREQADVGALWRGTVEHVASKTVRHIGELGDLVEFVKETTGWEQDSPDAR